MSKINPKPQNPPYSLPPMDKSNEFSKNHKRSDKKPNKSLKLKKTTRTMNLDPKITMKHAKSISGTGQVEIEDGEDVGGDGMVSEEGFGIKVMNLSSSEFGKTSVSKEIEGHSNGNTGRPLSFSSVVQGSNNNGDVVPCTINEGRLMVDIDPLIEEGSKKWGLTVIVLFKFKSKDGLQSVIENGSWLVDQKPLFVQTWVAGICLNKPEPTRIPLWVKIYNVPLEAWNVEGISRIASRIGTPIIMDKVTTSMCQRGFKRCNYQVLSEEEKNERMEAKMQANTKLGNAEKLNDWWHKKRYVPVKSNVKENVSVKDSMQKQENSKGKKGDEGIKINIDVACDMCVPIDDEEVKKWPQDPQEYYKDRCSRMKTGEKRELLKNKIKILEGDINTSIRNIDLKYHEKANGNVVEEMENSGTSRDQAFDVVFDRALKDENDRIQGLILKKQLAKVELFIMSDTPLCAAIKDGWTYLGEAMEDEVGEDLSNHVEFMTQDNVSSPVDASMANTVGNVNAESSSFIKLVSMLLLGTLEV
ncbi:zinc knuckle CX2CX4HX4C containing protein [Tanacetum coccineum]